MAVIALPVHMKSSPHSRPHAQENRSILQRMRLCYFRWWISAMVAAMDDPLTVCAFSALDDHKRVNSCLRSCIYRCISRSKHPATRASDLSCVLSRKFRQNLLPLTYFLACLLQTIVGPLPSCILIPYFNFWN
jgi:hypothetical protein